jgi:glutaredoxin
MRYARLALLLLGASACKKSPAPAAAADAGRSIAEPVPIRVTADRPDLMFSYQDEQGQFHDTQKLADIPEAARKSVLVRDLSLKPEEVHADEYLYLADLTQPEDGGYPYSLVSRYRFRPSAGTTFDEDGGISEAGVVLYGTSWCGACAQARKYFSDKHIPFVDKDIEADQMAANELAFKAKRARVSFKGVPVIDVRGHLMEGFNPMAVEQALRGP